MPHAQTQLDPPGFIDKFEIHAMNKTRRTKIRSRGMAVLAELGKIESERWVAHRFRCYTKTKINAEAHPFATFSHAFALFSLGFALFSLAFAMFSHQKSKVVLLFLQKFHTHKDCSLIEACHPID